MDLPPALTPGVFSCRWPRNQSRSRSGRLSIGDEQYFPWWPQSTLDEKFERYMTDLVDLASRIPEGVPLGLHWCYGTWGGWPMTAPRAATLRASREGRSARGIASER